MGTTLSVLLICAGLGAWLAGHKGRTRIGWAILCFFLGFLGLIILACMPNLRKRAATVAATAQATNQNSTNVVVNIPGYPGMYPVAPALAGHAYAPQAASPQAIGVAGQPAPLPYPTGYPAAPYYPVAPATIVPTPEPLTPQPIQSAHPPFCTACGSALAPESVFCPQCGQALQISA